MQKCGRDRKAVASDKLSVRANEQGLAKVLLQVKEWITLPKRRVRCGHRRRVCSYRYFIVLRNGFLHLSELQDLRRPVFRAHNRSHPAILPSSRGQLRVLTVALPSGPLAPAAVVSVEAAQASLRPTDLSALIINQSGNRM